MRRVAIMGPGGAGKSTLARELGARSGLPVVHLDRHFWHPGWVETPLEQWRSVQERLFVADEWIADGNYSATAEVRLRRADTVVLLDFPAWRTVPRALRRSLTHYGKAVQAEDCPERVDPKFFLWIVNYRRRSRPKVLRAIEMHAPTAAVHVLHGPREVRAFLGEVP